MWINQELKQKLSSLNAAGQSRGNCYVLSPSWPMLCHDVRFSLFWRKLRNHSNFSSWIISHVAYCTGALES